MVDYEYVNTDDYIKMAIDKLLPLLPSGGKARLVPLRVGLTVTPSCYDRDDEFYVYDGTRTYHVYKQNWGISQKETGFILLNVELLNMDGLVSEGLFDMLDMLLLYKKPYGASDYSLDLRYILGYIPFVKPADLKAKALEWGQYDIAMAIIEPNVDAYTELWFQKLSKSDLEDYVDEYGEPIVMLNLLALTTDPTDYFFKTEYEVEEAAAPTGAGAMFTF